jgi:dihydrofolate reductase
MGRLIFSMNMTLDGFIEGPGGDLGWSIADEELHRYFGDEQRVNKVNLYGRRLYETMDYWRTVDLEGLSDHEVDFGRLWRATPTVVFSRTLDGVEGNARLFKGDAATEIKRLKDQTDGVLSIGGATLASSLPPGLIDEYRVVVHPVTIGSGTTFFQNQRLKLRLLETRRLNSGVVLLRYEQSAA